MDPEFNITNEMDEATHAHAEEYARKKLIRLALEGAPKWEIARWKRVLRFIKDPTAILQFDIPLTFFERIRQ